MPEKTNKPRTVEDIRNEYARVCAMVGEREWKSRAMRRELDEELYPRLAELNAEAARAEKTTPSKEP